MAGIWIKASDNLYINELHGLKKTTEIKKSWNTCENKILLTDMYMQKEETDKERDW